MPVLPNWVDAPRRAVSRILTPRVRGILRLLWLVFVSAFVLRYLVRHWSSITDVFRSFSWVVLVSTVVVTILGKLAVCTQSRTTTELLDHRFGFRHAFWMYSASDLVKYVPGGLWHALARVRLYTDTGMSASAASKAFALEKYWMIVGAFSVGAFMMVPSGLRAIDLSDSTPAVLTLRLVVVVVWVSATWVGARITTTSLSVTVMVKSLSEQLAMAVFLGVGVWIPLNAVNADVSLWTAIGSFSLGRGLGYAAVFAPAGIGVREAVTLWAIGPTDASTRAIVVALGVNRVMTFVADVTSFGLSFAVKPRPNGDT